MSNEQKEAAYYAAQVEAWLNTRFEHDKSLLSLSAGGIGLLITLLSVTGVKSVESLVLYILALFAFLLCLGSVLWIFRRNAKHLEDVVQNKASDDQVLAFLDNLSVSAFLLGVLLSSIIGVSSAVHSYQDKERQMAEEKSNFRESVSGVSRVSPDGKVKLSVDGISRMNPTGTAAPATAQPAAPAAPSSPAPSQSSNTSDNKLTP